MTFVTRFVPITASIGAALLALTACSSQPQTINGCVIQPGTQCPGVNLAGTNLSNVDLSNSSLAGANLLGANLTNADLTNANLRGADLGGANLTGVQGIQAAVNVKYYGEGALLNTLTICPSGQRAASLNPASGLGLPELFTCEQVAPTP